MLKGVYAITPDWSDSRRLLEVTEAILRGGCRLLQYRNKTVSSGVKLQQAEALRELSRRHEARLIINDDLELALASQADGLHLGREDGALEEARLRLGGDKIIGASCYQELELGRAALAGGANYIAFGSFFPSPTKPGAGRAPLTLLPAARHLGAPVAAIGGITLANARVLVEAGADMLAIISALYDAPDPEYASRAFQLLFQSV